MSQDDARSSHAKGDVRTQGRVVAVDLTTGQPLWSVQAGAYLLGVVYR